MITTRTPTRAGKKITTIFVVFGTVAVLTSFYHWWFSDERAIRRQLTTIATALTIDPNEGELGPMTRIATLRKALATDVRIAAGTEEVVSREAVLGLATRWTAPAGGVTVEFDDVQVTVHVDRESADVYCTAKLTGRDVRTGDPTVDARELTVGFAKRDGAWVVGSARTESTLER